MERKKIRGSKIVQIFRILYMYRILYEGQEAQIGDRRKKVAIAMKKI